MSSSARLTSASPLAIALGMLAIYIVWGTTYLAIRVVVEPPLLELVESCE